MDNITQCNLIPSILSKVCTDDNMSSITVPFSATFSIVLTPYWPNVGIKEFMLWRLVNNRHVSFNTFLNIVRYRETSSLVTNKHALFHAHKYWFREGFIIKHHWATSPNKTFYCLRKCTGYVYNYFWKSTGNIRIDGIIFWKSLYKTHVSSFPLYTCPKTGRIVTNRVPK